MTETSGTIKVIHFPFHKEYKSWDRAVDLEFADCPVQEGVRCKSRTPCRKCHHVEEYMNNGTD